jgi:hypothetical protein
MTGSFPLFLVKKSGIPISGEEEGIPISGEKEGNS